MCCKARPVNQLPLSLHFKISTKWVIRSKPVCMLRAPPTCTALHWILHHSAKGFFKWMLRQGKSACERIHDIRTLLEDPVKAVANLESSVLEPKRYTTDYYEDTCYQLAERLTELRFPCQTTLRSTRSLISYCASS